MNQVEQCIPVAGQDEAEFVQFVDDSVNRSSQSGSAGVIRRKRRHASPKQAQLLERLSGLLGCHRMRGMNGSKTLPFTICSNDQAAICHLPYPMSGASMNALLEHAWGKSPAQDRIWAQVTGLRLNEAVERRLMALQAFMDDSRTDGGVFVLAGWIASAEKWVRFARDWEELLPGTRKGLNGKHRFKMAEMVQSERERELVGAFYHVIESIEPVGLCVKLHIGELRRAISRIWSLDGPLDVGHLKNPYLVSLFFLIHSFHSKEREALSEFLPDDAVVDFIFDDQSEKGVILRAWDKFLGNLDPKQRQMYGATPRFENDERFLPLQAADMIAWCQREGYERGKNFDTIFLAFTERFKMKKKLVTFNLELTEDIIANKLIEMFRMEAPNISIYDKNDERPLTI